MKILPANENFADAPSYLLSSTLIACHFFMNKMRNELQDQLKITKFSIFISIINAGSFR